MQWKDVDHPTFARMCKLAINWLDYSQWCIAKNGGGYTQRGVANGLKVPCLFMITEVSIIRCQKNPEVGIRRIPAYTPNTPLTIATVFLGYRRTAYDRLFASWKDNYWSVLGRTNIQVTRCHQAETVTKVVT